MLLKSVIACLAATAFVATTALKKPDRRPVAVVAKRRESATLNAHNDQDPTGEAGSQVAFR